jgi:hypothetical protein
MVSGKSIFRLLCAVFFVVLLAQADDGSGTDAFCERAQSEFNSLLRLCKSDRVGYWRQRSDDAIQRYVAKSKELDATSKYLGRQSNGKELQEVFAFDYLNRVHELQLSETTRLVEDLGRELLNDRLTARLVPRIEHVEAQFATLRGKPQSEGVLQNSYGRFVELQRSVARIEAETPVKETFSFQPKDNAFASEPIKTVVYTIHDWNAALTRVGELERQLQPIQDTLQTARFFSPKDPIPWLPVITQLTFLMVATAGWIKSYHSDTAFWAIGILVALSMLISVFLVFYSDETLLNILRQSILPGIFILYWIGKSNNWFRRARKTGA